MRRFIVDTLYVVAALACFALIGVMLAWRG